MIEPDESDEDGRQLILILGKAGGIIFLGSDILVEIRHAQAVMNASRHAHM